MHTLLNTSKMLLTRIKHWIIQITTVYFFNRPLKYSLHKHQNASVEKARYCFYLSFNATPWKQYSTVTTTYNCHSKLSLVGYKVLQKLRNGSYCFER